jgi:hypothetical protein
MEPSVFARLLALAGSTEAARLGNGLLLARQDMSSTSNTAGEWFLFKLSDVVD